MLSALNFLKKSNPRYAMTCSRALSSNIQQSPFGGLDAAPTELLSDYISKDWAKVESQQFIYEGITNSSLTYKQLTERTANFAASMADEGEKCEQ